MRRSMAAWIPGSGEGRSPLAVPIRRSLGLPSAAPSENGLHQHSRHYHLARELRIKDSTLRRLAQERSG